MKNQSSLIMRLIIALCLAVSLGGIPENTVQAATYTFNISIPPPPDSVDINPGDKICLDAAGKCSLRAALQESNAGNGIDIYIIQLSSGVHQLSSSNPNLNIDKSVTINNDTGALAMIKGYNETGTININNYFAGSHVRINNVTLSDFSTAITHKQLNFTCTNCTIQYNKRGISVEGGTATIRSSLVTENEGSHCPGANISGGELYTYTSAFTHNNTTSTLETDRGGAVCNKNGNLYLLESSSIAYNGATSTNARKNGGGLYHSSPLVTSITDSSIFENEGVLGGGIYAINGTLYIRSASEIYNNHAAIDGGGAYFSNAIVNIEEDSEISTNTAAGYGGGIFAAGDVRINRGIISGNQALFGGGIYHQDAYLTIDNSVIKNNTSVSTMTGGGGGLYVESSFNLYITNTTISGNQAKFHGGGAYLAIGYVDLSNVTVTNNTCDSDLNSPTALGGGVYVGGTTQFYARNSILAANTDPTGTINEPDIAGILRSQGYNLIGACGSTCGITSITTGNMRGTPGSPIDPLLEPLTMYDVPPFFTYYHPLRETSPAVHAGDPAGCKDSTGATLVLDQLGQARSQYGRCDMGAAESPYSPPPIYYVFLPLLKR